MTWEQWGHKREVSGSLWEPQESVTEMLLMLRLERGASVDQNNKTKWKKH